MKLPATVSEPMQHAPDDYAALMLDYAAGALPPAFRLLVEVHADLNRGARGWVAQADATGGALLEQVEPVPMAATLLPPRLVEQPEKADAWSAARSRITLAADGADGLAWRRSLFGFMDHRLPIAGASLLKIPAGRAMPRHTHGGDELTLVLRGAFADERGLYQAGELVFADAHVEHTPRVIGDAECVCLTAETGALRIRTWWARPLAGLLN